MGEDNRVGKAKKERVTSAQMLSPCCQKPLRFWGTLKQWLCDGCGEECNPSIEKQEQEEDHAG